MEVKDGYRYRGPIVGRSFGRKSKDEQTEFIDLTLGATQYFDPATNRWEPFGEYGQPIEASYFIRSRGELNQKAIEAFADASGWDMDPETFDVQTWVPREIQVRLKLKPKADGDGQWLTITAIAAYDAITCGSGKSITSTMEEFRRLTGRPSLPPPPPVAVHADGITTLPDGDDIPF